MSNNFSLSIYGNVDLRVSIMIKMYVLLMTLFLGTLYFYYQKESNAFVSVFGFFPLLFINIHPIMFKLVDIFKCRLVEIKLLLINTYMYKKK